MDFAFLESVLADNDEVFVFKRAPDEVEVDTAAGVARVGGLWRPVNYLGTYVRGARVLVGIGKSASELDQLALPILYLQRHATELLLKRLIIGMIAVYDERWADGVADNASPISRGVRDRAHECHDLRSLLRDLVSSAMAINHFSPPDGLADLVNRISSCEVRPDWARYDTGRTGENYMRNKVMLPLGAIQDELDALVASCLVRSSDDTGKYEWEIYAELHAAAQHR